jgi:hypothetical protein
MQETGVAFFHVFEIGSCLERSAFYTVTRPVDHWNNSAMVRFAACVELLDTSSALFFTCFIIFPLPFFFQV